MGRFEHLVEDTSESLRLAGEPFSTLAIRRHPRENVNDYRRFPALYRREVAARLAEAEHETIERFYPVDPIPADLLQREHGNVLLPPELALPERASSEPSASHRLERAQERVRGVERALSLSRRAEGRLEIALTEARTERDQAASALALLRSSHLLRYTRPLRTAYYRAHLRQRLARASRRALTHAPVG